MTKSHWGTSVHRAVMSPFNVEVMMIGHFARDRLVVDGHREFASGGAVYYGGMALRRVGVERVMFGSDYPWSNPLLDAARIQRLPLTDGEKRAVLHDNAVRVLAL